MAGVGSGDAPVLAAWVDVDPARYAFDPVEAPVVVRSILSVPLPRQVWQGGRLVEGSQVWAWVDAVGAALSEVYGPWAYRWDWAGPGESQRLGWVTDRLSHAAAADVVTDSLLHWRGWLEDLARRFDQFLPLLRLDQAAGSDDVVVRWEAAIAQVMTTVIAPVADDDGWQGWCRRVLQWFLSAAGVSAEQAGAAVDRAIDERFNYWVPPTAAVVSEVAARLVSDVLDVAGVAQAAQSGSWPDTWPQGWPSRRATNTGWAVGGHTGLPR